jgi:tRNA modification GTPase
MFGNTITALATVPMNGAIHIIRVSGIDTYKILSTITKKKIKKAGYSIERAMIYDQQTVIDDVLLMKFVSPKSFTGEDLIEINCHGGLFIANKIISLLIKNGVSLAKNGEFTKLAFMNKKLNLNQANAINNLIKSTSEKGIEFAHNGLNTETNKKLEELCDILFRLIGQIEVNIDYPEYDDIQKYIKEDVIGRLEAINEMIKLIVSNSKDMIKHVEGYNIAIIGKPNAGKSSLLNALLNEDKAIVSNISGTTRDIVEGKINIKGLNFNILDTAGIKEHTSSKLEKIGIKKTIDSLDKADIII